jgi:hypothetical protein
MVPHLNNQNSPYYMATYQCPSDQIRLRYQSPDGAERGKLRLVQNSQCKNIIYICGAIRNEKRRSGWLNPSRVDVEPCWIHAYIITMGCRARVTGERRWTEGRSYLACLLYRM